MIHYALLCGSAPNDFRQKKLEDLHNELLIKDGWHVTAFANGVDELTLEYALNNIFDGNAGDNAEEIPNQVRNDSAQLRNDSVQHVSVWHASVLLYFCARSEADLNAKMADADCEVVRLGENEIRRDVIAYYAELAERFGLDFQIVYDWDSEWVSEESLGYEKVTAEDAMEVREFLEWIK